MTNQEKSKIIRNIIILSVGTLLLATGGGFIMASGQEAGGLLFILSPLVMALVVRFLLRDGWKDAGLRLNIKESWGWYLFALLIYPIIYLLTISISSVLGFSTITGSVSEFIPVMLSGFAIQLVPRMIFALSEEWAWRGYLEPRLMALGIPDIRRHLIVGIIWGFWHFPLILSTDYTNIPHWLFLPFFMVGVLLMAIIYGPMRKASGSVWPAVLMHGLANAVAFAILESDLLVYNNELLGSIGTGGVATTVIYAVVVFLMLRFRPDLFQAN